MVKALSYFRRRPELTVEAFQDYWRSKHPEVVTGLPGIRGYVQSHTLIEGYRKARPLYDGIAEVWFEDTAAMRALAGTPAMRAVEAGSEGVEYVAFGAGDDPRDADMVQGWWSD